MLIGICAYNEENNIGRLLQNLISKQNLSENSEIVVVCSGCTDRTPQITKEYERKDSRIKSIIEEARKGKVNALNRLFRLARKSAEVLVLVNADALPGQRSIEKLVFKLANKKVGVVFAQPIPFEEFSGTTYNIVRVIWRLHHIISLRTPKLSGELCAIRVSCLQEIPENVATDEPYIEFGIQKRGYDLLYVPEALVFIRCPTNVVDLFKHRRRIWLGHMQLQRATSFEVSTSNFQNILRAIPILKITEIPYLLLGGFLEVIAYFLARIDFRKGIIPYVWEPIRSTKTSYT